MMRARLFYLGSLVLALALVRQRADAEDLFRDRVAPLLSARCLTCHDQQHRKGGLALDTPDGLHQGGDSGAAIEPGDHEASLLWEMVSGSEPEMPKNGPPLDADQLAALRAWINAGAKWPEGLELKPTNVADPNWWSLRPVIAPPVPDIERGTPANQRWARTPIDAFILAKLREHGLEPSGEADRRTLARRLYFDLVGLPPPPAVVEAFVRDPDPRAYERLVDRLLAYPQYGERWARHWLDVVHYADTHGYDKDKPRPNAWPYRDYVIRSFNADTPYERFVREQIAGDVLWPDNPDAITATGFIAAGPWDFIGHAEVPETKIDGMIARNLDRDDMVTSTLNTFMSLTVQCARCHDHKFDPVTQEHYYGLQAVFAALDRADRPYDRDPQVARQRRALAQQQQALRRQMAELQQQIDQIIGPHVAEIDRQIAHLQQRIAADLRPEYGYHSYIESAQDAVKWVQVDLQQPVPIRHVVLVGCYDEFNNIGAGFGFPVRYQVALSNDPSFTKDVTVIADYTGTDVVNPGVVPQTIDAEDQVARFVRVTATRLAPRQDDYIFALAELMVLTIEGTNAAFSKPVTALDSIEAPGRWRRQNLVDGIFYKTQVVDDPFQQLLQLCRQRQNLWTELLPEELRENRRAIQQQLASVQAEQDALPAPSYVYAGTVHYGSGAFRGTGPDGGKPREIYVLVRGDVKARGRRASPGTVPLIPGVAAQFDLPADAVEGNRRVALANWLVHHDNPLVWRSIVNRVWLYHFGQGIVDTPNDFGRMGSLPSHPELLDWLAVWLRDNGQSLKALHRLILTSSVYRQDSAHRADAAAIDSGNRYLWRMNRRALEAEVLRDTVLAVSGRLQTAMYGPAFQDFVIEKPEHSPHYEYHKHDPNDPQGHRRAIYRFVVRSQPQPFMQTLDCADPSQSVPQRNTTLTALQALTLLNNDFMLCMAQHFADRLQSTCSDPDQQVRWGYQLALARDPDSDEVAALTAYAQQYGLANACRLIFNLNEFLFVD